MRVAIVETARRREGALFIASVIGIAAVVAVLALTLPGPAPHGGTPVVASPTGLNSFQSYSQLRAYVEANAKSAQQYNRYGVGFGGRLPLNNKDVTFTASATVAAQSIVTSVPSFTGTNVQVQGVDEPDRVKTDGTHLFVSTTDSVSIINAYPPNSTSVLSTLKFPTATVQGIEIAQGRLMVIEGGPSYPVYPLAEMRPAISVQPYPYSYSPNVELLLYDTTNLASPKLMQNVTVQGSFVAARLADGYVYAIIQQPSYVFDNQGNATAVLPTASVAGSTSILPPTSVFYTPVAVQVSYYTVIPSISMSTGKESVISALTGPSANVYVSNSNIYVVYSNYLDLYDVDGVPGNYFSGGVISIQDFGQSQNSTIMRVAYINGTVTVTKAGIVPGTTLNQFSMDEYNGYFRIATTRQAVLGGTPTTSDDVYVLDANMSQVSALTNIAPGENIYAVRFVGQTGYVVTFEQIDPLFVISFKDVSHPVIESALKVSGYSDYLHPLPGGYLIGVGKDSVPASNGNFAYYLGLKLSLFRVFGNGSSTLVDNMLIGDRGTDSPVLSDHLAFTFDPTRNITVIPLTLYVVSGNQSVSSGFPSYGNPVWQGVYVIKVTPTGFALLGKVSQYSGQSFADTTNPNLQIDRSVIIGDYLYTISQGEVMVSSLSNFATVATVQLPG